MCTVYYVAFRMVTHKTVCITVKHLNTIIVILVVNNAWLIYSRENY